MARLTPAEVTLLPLGEERFGDGDRIFRYGSLFRGLAVLGGNASLRVDKAGFAREAMHPQQITWPSDIVPTVTKAAAHADIQARTRFGLHDEHLHLGVYLRFGVAHLAWFGFPTVPASLPSRQRIVLDAHTGELIEAVDLAQSITAQMYRSNPTASPTLEALELPMPETTAGTLEGPLLVAKNCVDNKTVRNVGGSFMIHVCDLVNSATLAGSGNYELVPQDGNIAAAAEDPFSQLSMYYHATRAYRYFQDLQGDENAQVVVTAPLTAVANLRIAAGSGFGTSGDYDPQTAANPNIALEPYENAFFSPGAPEGQFDPYGEIFGVTGGGMFFGQSADRDFAYDGDVVYHEFTHAVVDKTLQLQGFALDEFGLSAAPGAMNEGLADFFSSAIAGDPQLGEYAGSRVQQGGAPIRSLTNTHTCPNNISGEVHADSTLFSGALWTARAQLAAADQKAFDASLYKSMRLNPGTYEPTYEDLATLFLAGLTADLPAAKPVLEAAFTTKGVLPKCTRVLEQTDDSPVLPPSDAHYFMSPGSASVGLRGLVPGVVQVHRVLPADSSNVRVAVYTLRSYSSGGFGGDSTFKPRLLVRFGAEPIEWKQSGSGVTPDVDLDLELIADEDDMLEVPIEVPAGVTEVYVQVANRSNANGVYIDLGVLRDVPKSPPDAGRPRGSSSSSSGDADAGPAADAPTADEGCGCHGAPARDAGGALTLALAALGLVAARRRR